MSMIDRRRALRLSAGVASSSALAALLSGCGATGAEITTAAGVAAGDAAAAADTITATVATDVAKATNLWGIAKGIGQVALAALTVTDPGAAAIVNSGITIADSAVKALSSPTVKAHAVQVAANVNTVIAQTQAVLLAAAPAITAVANQA